MANKKEDESLKEVISQENTTEQSLEKVTDENNRKISVKKPVAYLHTCIPA